MRSTHRGPVRRPGRPTGPQWTGDQLRFPAKFLRRDSSGSTDHGCRRNSRRNSGDSGAIATTAAPAVIRTRDAPPRSLPEWPGASKTGRLVPTCGPLPGRPGSRLSTPGSAGWVGAGRHSRVTMRLVRLGSCGFHRGIPAARAAAGPRATRTLPRAVRIDSGARTLTPCTLRMPQLLASVNAPRAKSARFRGAGLESIWT
jgi:hypothetical protein